MLMQLFVICAIAVAAIGGEYVDYCHKKMCISGQHVRCNNNGEFSKDCIGEYQLEDLTPYRQLILDEHNYYRNLIASGALPGFDAAVRMPAITAWDDDLTINAEYNVKSCVFAHDQCRSTTRYTYAGQNIYYERTTNLSIPIVEEIRDAVRLWFEEYRDADRELLLSYHKTIPQTGHFTLLVTDRLTALGCAYLNNLQTNEGERTKRMTIFTCNYSSTNIRDYPSYKAGAAASQCERTHDAYPALCANEINPNDVSWYKV